MNDLNYLEEGMFNNVKIKVIVVHDFNKYTVEANNPEYENLPGELRYIGKDILLNIKGREPKNYHVKKE